MTTYTYSSKDSVPFRIFAGVRNRWTISLQNNDGSAKNATGYSMYCQLRDKPGGKLLADMEMDDTDIATGVYVMSHEAVESALLGARSGVYDILFREDADHTNVVRLFGGRVEIIPVVTEVA